VASLWITAPLAAAIGLLVGLIGAGPSILTVLLLQHAGGMPLAAAVTTSLVVVALMSLVAVVPYARAGEVLWTSALGFGVASMTGAFLAGHLSARVPERARFLVFLLAMVIAAVSMLWRRPPPDQAAPRPRLRTVAVLGAGGLLVGTITGLIGLGGGFAVVPLLVVFLRAPVRAAVGTSILVIALNTLAALAGRLPHVVVDWQVAGYLGAVESLGSLAGVRLAHHVASRTLCRVFGGLMLAAAAFLIGNAARG
jgi:hypothetical protein